MNTITALLGRIEKYWNINVILQNSVEACAPMASLLWSAPSHDYNMYNSAISIHKCLTCVMMSCGVSFILYDALSISTFYDHPTHIEANYLGVYDCM